MTRVKKESEFQMLISIEAISTETKTFEEIKKAVYGTDVCLLFSSGGWVAHYYRLIKNNHEMQSIGLPGSASLLIVPYGRIDTKLHDRVCSELHQFCTDLSGVVLDPFLDYWATKVAKMGRPAGEKELSQVQDHLFGVFGYFAYWLPKIASSLWGRKKIQKGGLETIKQWYTETVLTYTINDVRVTLGNQELANAMKSYFKSLLKEQFSSLLPIQASYFNL